MHLENGSHEVAIALLHLQSNGRDKPNQANWWLLQQVAFALVLQSHRSYQHVSPKPHTEPAQAIHMQTPATHCAVATSLLQLRWGGLVPAAASCRCSSHLPGCRLCPCCRRSRLRRRRRPPQGQVGVRRACVHVQAVCRLVSQAPDTYGSLGVIVAQVYHCEVGRADLHWASLDAEETLGTCQSKVISQHGL